MQDPAPDAPLPDPMAAWLRHLESNRRYSPHTLDGYRRELGFLIELAERAKLPLERLGNGHIRHFVARLHAQGRGPRSLARTLAAWRGFYQWWAPAIGLAGNPV
ncbi:site-specific integrase, partial [Achromobacter xylosoxidans]